MAENSRVRNVRAIECVEPVELELVTKTMSSTVLPLLQSKMNLTIVSAVVENSLVTRELPKNLPEEFGTAFSQVLTTPSDDDDDGEDHEAVVVAAHPVHPHIHAPTKSPPLPLLLPPLLLTTSSNAF